MMNERFGLFYLFIFIYERLIGISIINLRCYMTYIMMNDSAHLHYFKNQTRQTLNRSDKIEDRT